MTNFPEYYEKAATKSLGRALAGLSFGTQFAPELDEKNRVVDSPVKRNGRASASDAESSGVGRTSPRTQPKVEMPRQTVPSDAPTGEKIGTDEEQPASEQQMMSIRKLCAALGREEPAPNVLTFSGASVLIRQLSREYNAARRAS